MNNEWEAFIEQMRGRYWIAYLPSAQRRGGELVKIEVQLKPSPKLNINDVALTYSRIAIIPSVK